MQIYKELWDYYEQIYGSKISNVEEMDRFLEKLNLPRLKQEEIEIMNNPITSPEIDTVIQNLTKQTNKQTNKQKQTKSQGPEGFTGKFY